MTQNKTCSSWAGRNLKETAKRTQRTLSRRRAWLAVAGGLVRRFSSWCVKWGSLAGQQGCCASASWFHLMVLSQKKNQIPLRSRQPFSFTRTANTFHNGQIMLICWSPFCKQRLIKHLLRQNGFDSDAHTLKICYLLLVCWSTIAYKMNWDKSCIWLPSHFPVCGLSTNPVQLKTAWIYAYEFKIDWI